MFKFETFGRGAMVSINFIIPFLFKINITKESSVTE